MELAPPLAIRALTIGFTWVNRISGAALVLFGIVAVAVALA